VDLVVWVNLVHFVCLGAFGYLGVFG
jgi:hypothetical protein